MKQLIKPDLNTTDLPGWCLRLVGNAFGLKNRPNPHAWAAWSNAKHRHTDGLPNAMVPVFFEWWGTIDGEYKNWGDVAIYVPGKGIFGTPKRGSGKSNRWDKDVATRAAWLGGKAKYVGWAEDLNGYRLVEPAPTKSNEQLAAEVINGAWGNGTERKRRLTESGYNYQAVQNIVNAKVSGKVAAPKPQVETYHLNQNVAGYRSSADAIARRNSNSTVPKGVYKLSSRVKGADHLVRADGSGGWWIKI